MIVVTGLGRSGTSLIALLYRELGFDPGGEWYEHMDAGLENPDVVTLNSRIIRGLGVGYPLRELPGWARGLEERLPGRAAAALRGWFEVTPEIWSRRPAVRWQRFDSVVRGLAPRLVAVARARTVAKDPRFCWTLGTWAAAGAPIDHVLVCLRNVDSVIGSRVRLGDLSPGSWSASRNAMIMAAGMCLTSIHDHGLEHAILRFPAFLDEPRRLYEVMRFPGPVPWETFSDAFDRVTDRGRVHDWR